MIIPCTLIQLHIFICLRRTTCLIKTNVKPVSYYTCNCSEKIGIFLFNKDNIFVNSILKTNSVEDANYTKYMSKPNAFHFSFYKPVKAILNNDIDICM